MESILESNYLRPVRELDSDASRQGLRAHHFDHLPFPGFQRFVGGLLQEIAFQSQVQNAHHAAQQASWVRTQGPLDLDGSLEVPGVFAWSSALAFDICLDSDCLNLGLHGARRGPVSAAMHAWPPLEFQSTAVGVLSHAPGELELPVFRRTVRPDESFRG